MADIDTSSLGDAKIPEETRPTLVRQETSHQVATNFASAETRLRNYLTRVPELRQSSIHQMRQTSIRSLLFAATESKDIALEAAVSYASQYAELTGNKPLIVDFDWQKRELTHIVGAELQPGLAQIIAGEREAPNYIDGGKISVLPIGQRAEFYSDDTAIEALKSAIQFLASQHSLTVWIGTSPVTDDSVTSSAAWFDGVAIALRSESTRTDIARYLRDRLIENGANVVGAVLCQRRLAIPKWFYDHL